MRITLSIAAIALGCVGVSAADSPGGTNVASRGSYALGANLGNNLRAQGVEPNVDLFIQGLKDGLGDKVTLKEPELREHYMAWQQELRAAKRKVADEFLAKKEKEQGVKKFPSGLLYKVITTGKGPQPKADDRVSAHYRGTLADGTEFDSSYTRGQPLVTAVRGVIPGWQEALTNMHVGDKWELYIPPQLGYGERGSGAKIGPNAALIFEMELLSIEPPVTNAPSAGPTLNIPGAGNQPIRVQPGQPGQPGGAPTIRVQPTQPAQPK